VFKSFVRSSFVEFESLAVFPQVLHLIKQHYALAQDSFLTRSMRYMVLSVCVCVCVSMCRHWLKRGAVELIRTRGIFIY